MFPSRHLFLPFRGIMLLLQLHNFRRILPPMNHRYFILLLSIFSVLALSSCHSSKKASSSTGYHKTDMKMEIDQRLDPVTKSLLEEARTWLGTKYKYGGHSKSGTDCSGMVMEVYYTTTGIKLPRNSGKQQEYCKNVAKKELRPGDLVFFSTDRRSGRIGHVGMYVGDGKMIHASSRGVMLSHLEENYWLKHYAGSGRVEAFATLAYASGNKQNKKKKKSPAPKKNEKKPLPLPEKITEPIVIIDSLQIGIDEVIDSAVIASPQWMDRTLF